MRFGVFLVVISFLALVDGFARPFSGVHRRRQRHVDASSTISCRMVRNIDLAEAIIFYGRDTFLESPSNTSNDDESTALPGVDNLLQECQRDETALLILLENDESLTSTTTLLKSKYPLANIYPMTQPAPNPKDLWESSQGLEIQPKGFGGSSGFGVKAADPPRPPLPQHVVVFASTEDQCRAARFVGMRVICLTDNPLADAVVFEGDWSSIGVDDIATPGSFWLNPPHPRDDDSNKVDVEEVIAEYEGTTTNISKSSGVTAETEEEEEEEEMSDEELQRILADLDPL